MKSKRRKVVKNNGYNDTKTLYITPFLFDLVKILLTVSILVFLGFSFKEGHTPIVNGYGLYYKDKLYLLSSDTSKFKNLYLLKTNGTLKISDSIGDDCIGSVVELNALLQRLFKD